PDSRAAQGHGVLFLRPQSHAVLGLCGRFHAWTYSWYVGAFSAGYSYGLRRLCRGDSAHGPGSGAGAAAVLRPQPPCRMVSGEPNPLGGWRPRREVTETPAPELVIFRGVCAERLSISLLLALNYFPVRNGSGAASISAG